MKESNKKKRFYYFVTYLLFPLIVVTVGGVTVFVVEGYLERNRQKKQETIELVEEINERISNIERELEESSDRHPALLKSTHSMIQNSLVGSKPFKQRFKDEKLLSLLSTLKNIQPRFDLDALIKDVRQMEQEFSETSKRWDGDFEFKDRDKFDKLFNKVLAEAKKLVGEVADWEPSVTNIYPDIGNIGFGTTAPKAKLHIKHSDFAGTPSLILENSRPQSQAYISFKVNNEEQACIYANEWGATVYNTRGGGLFFKSGGDIKMIIQDSGNVGIGTTSPRGRLDVNGSIYQRGSQLHSNYVFEPGYELESIEEHSEFMWQHRHLKAIPKAKVDADGQEVVEIGAHRKGIVEELEKAHIYIEQLHKRMKSLEEKLVKLEAGLSAGGL